MTKQSTRETYVAFLRGINVGGHHKLPMADLKVLFESLGYTHIKTLLNSGNVIFDAPLQDIKELEHTIEKTVETNVGFPVPTCVREASFIVRFRESDPFKNKNITKDTRCYISFLKDDVIADIRLPWTSDDNSYQIIEKRGETILSVLDLSLSQTTKAMRILEVTYGKNITTRNWKTIERIIKKLLN
ncbi:DUF1697 domain-containing protein [Dokdonia ponticola]|uniref:DUF1697 domain-containing protein n=1 Tax=Dokdonia ponticola TaxID=2041041 RepID=A0ABV9HSP8_9FLAO